MQIRDLFAPEEVDTGVVVPIKFFDSVEEPVDRATRRIRKVLMDRHPAVLAFSAGKDSSCLAAIVLLTAKNLISEGIECPPIMVLHSNTLVEQPEIVDLAHDEITKMRVYAKANGIPLQTRIGTPELSASWAVRVIGGRALPAFPSSRADCSTDWKVKVNERLMAQAFDYLNAQGQWKQPVVMTGVRLDESISRDQRIKKRGEQAEGIWFNEFGHARLSPILDFTVDDVWEFIGLSNAGVMDAYSTFEETMRIYRAAGGSSCVIVADMKAQAHSKPCGARTGCWACTRVNNDRSMQNMIESDHKLYGHLKPLARLRDFMSNTQYDWDRRQFVGRSIDDDGYITIQADTFNPKMLEELLRYALTAEILSGVPIISIEALIAIDARWSMYGLMPPFSALKIYFETVNGDHRLAPEVQRFPPTQVPRLGKIKVGPPNYRQAMHGTVSGLRNVGAELFHESCGWELKGLKDGSLVIDCEDEGGVDVDPQGAADFLEFEAERMIADYCHESCSDWTWGYKTYVQWGTITVAKGRSQQAHDILLRSQWRQANNLHGYRTPEELEARCDVLFSRQLELMAA